MGENSPLYATSYNVLVFWKVTAKYSVYGIWKSVKVFSDTGYAVYGAHNVAVACFFLSPPKTPWEFLWKLKLQRPFLIYAHKSRVL